MSVKAADVKYESYSTATLTDFIALDINFMAQTFTATSDHNVTDIVLWFYRLGSPGLFNVSIRETTIGGVPTDVDLADCNNTDGDMFSTVLGSPTKVVFKLSSEIELSEDTEYAIVVSWPSNGDESNQLRWVEGWDSYTGGKLIKGASNGQDWDEADFGDDAYFEIWDIEIQYSLTMITIGNGDVTPGNQTYISGTNIDIDAISPVGWSFSGWTGDVSGNANTTIVMDSNKTVTATFTQQYTFTMITIGNGNVTPGNQTYLSGINININAINAAGWSFTGWSGDASGNANTTIVMDSNKTVTATFTQDAIPEMPSSVMLLLLIAVTLGIALVVKKRSSLN